MTEELHHWRDLKGNPFMQKFDFRMLRPKGVGIRREVKLGRRGSCCSQKTRVAVLYDREFVVAKLHSLLTPFILARTPKQDILWLVSEALDYLPPQG